MTDNANAPAKPDPKDSAIATPPPAPSVPPTSFQRIWAKFRRSGGARLGLYLVVAFSLTALLAPFLAHRLPFVWQDAKGGAYTFPLIREFFSPSDTTEPMLERGINFLFLYIPLGCLALHLMTKYAPALERTRSRFVSLLFGALLAASLWFAIGGMVVDGGGRDWLHNETPPVPELDDFADINAFWPQVLQNTGNGPEVLRVSQDSLSAEDQDAMMARPPADGRTQAAWALLAPALRMSVASDVIAPGPDTDEGRRWILALVQHLVEGPPMVRPGTMLKAGVDTHGITEAMLDRPLDSARLNRILVEAALPGVLTPMRQFRSTFLLMAAASLLVLLGLTYICLAGAWQFTLTPRWLVMLVLAVLLSLAFQAPARHDHTPYRQRAAAGDGWGIFPPIPYGPNEQGFGPRLPPSWHMETPELSLDAIVDWPFLTATLANPETPASHKLASLLERELPDWRARAGTEEGRAPIAAALNRIIDGAGFYDSELAASLRGDINLTPYFAEEQSDRPLSNLHRRRMNRLLLEKAVPGTVKPVTAVRWKKPRHSQGYHVVGTDESGRDVLVRLIHGARVSLSVGFVSVFLATVLGLVMGSLAAYYGGKVDIAISRFMEILMCFPSFFLILAVIAVLDRRSIINIMLVIGLTSWTGVARLVRGEMLKQKKMDYVSASIALGASDTRTIFRQILPNTLAPVLVSISFGITGAILTEASLSFIGFGVTPPTPTWGQLLSETRESPLANWWLVVFPGCILFFSVLAYNMVGEGLRDALDPRST